LHPPIELDKSCKLLHVREYVVTVWFTWLKMNHTGYKNTTMNMDVLNTLPKNDIPEPIMRSMFQSTNIELANAKHCMNITYLHQQKGTMKLNMS
jgi:hypothetical protein